MHDTSHRLRPLLLIALLALGALLSIGTGFGTRRIPAPARPKFPRCPQAGPKHCRGVIQRCYLERGRIHDCRENIDDAVVLLRQGAYRSCTSRKGVVTECGAPYTGLTVLSHHGIYHRCRIEAGRKTHCTRPYTGHAKLER